MRTLADVPASEKAVVEALKARVDELRETYGDPAALNGLLVLYVNACLSFGLEDEMREVLEATLDDLPRLKELFDAKKRGRQH